MRLWLALQCFFAVLLGRTVPVRALPPPAEEPPQQKAAREQAARDLGDARARLAEHERAAALAREKAAALERERDEKAAEAARARDELRAAQEAGKARLSSARNDGALALLAALQRDGRLVDFLMEPIDGFKDAEVGAAVRAVHQGCRKALGNAVALEPVLGGAEGARVEVAAGFDPVAIQLSGNVRGSPPFKGTLMHHGWRVQKAEVAVPEAVDLRVLAPAEVEL